MWNEGPLGAYKHSLLKLWIKTPISKKATGSLFSAYRKRTHALIMLLLYAHQLSWRFWHGVFNDGHRTMWHMEIREGEMASFQSKVKHRWEFNRRLILQYTHSHWKPHKQRPNRFQFRETQLTLHRVLNPDEFGQMIISICLCEVRTVISDFSSDWSGIHTLLSQIV